MNDWDNGPTIGSSVNEGATDRPPGIPRWVKVFGIVVVVVVLVFVVLQLAGVGGRHGPGMHGAEAPLRGNHGVTSNVAVAVG